MAKRVKTSIILRHARERIETKAEDFICLAIEQYPYDHWDTEASINRVLRLIHRRMQMGRFENWVMDHRGWYFDDPYYYAETSLDWWLVWKRHVTANERPTKAQMREYRLAWLDELIKEFETKGD